MNVQQLARDVTKGKMPQTAGGRLNIKKLSYQYRDPHVKDKDGLTTVISLAWGSPYLGKTVFILRQGPGNLASHPGEKEIWFSVILVTKIMCYSSNLKQKMNVTWCFFLLKILLLNREAVGNAMIFTEISLEFIIFLISMFILNLIKK